jgi:hypothetical protein
MCRPDPVAFLLLFKNFCYGVFCWAEPKIKKGLSPLYPAIWPYFIFSLITKILPTKDALFLPVPYTFWG